MNGIRIFLILVMVIFLGSCSLQPVLTRLAWFDSEPPPKVGISSGTLAVLPLRGPQDSTTTLHDDTLNYFRRFMPMNHTALWKGQPILAEEQLFHESTARQLQALGVQWVLTGRYQPPPKGFLTLEVIGVGDKFPFWMFGLPWTEGEQGSEVVDLALHRFGEKMGLQGRAVVFPVLDKEGFYLPALKNPVSVAVDSPKVAVVAQEDLPFAAKWTMEPLMADPRPVIEAGVVAPFLGAVSSLDQQADKEPIWVSEILPDTALIVPPPASPDVVAKVALTIPPTPPQGVQAQGVDGKKERYVLQVGVFAKIETALEMVQELRKRGYEPEISQIPGTPGGTAVDNPAWRVWIGLYDRYLDASEQAEAFLSKESLPVHVALQTNRKILFRYAVQVGSFLVPATGWDLAAKLRLKGYEATVQESKDAADRVWHSVWIGRYWTLAQARREAKIFRDKEDMAVFVTPVDAYSSIRMLTNASLAPAQVKESVPQWEVMSKVVAPQPVRYVVQVGSFSEENRAQTLVDQLRTKGYVSQIVSQTDGKGRVWRMVWIGRFQNFSNARRMRDNYRSQESQPAFITTIPAM